MIKCAPSFPDRFQIRGTFASRARDVSDWDHVN